MKPLLGFFWLCVMFAASFSCVHITLSLLQPLKRKPAEKEVVASESPKREKPETPKNEKVAAPEPVYYIVEKKSRRKSGYSKPKRIKFE